MGLRQAAGEVHDRQKEILLGASRQRRDFALQLQEEVRKLGSVPAEKGSLLGLFHRGWMDLRYRTTHKSDEGVLRECRRGEELALKAYEDAFESKILTGKEPVVERLFVSLIEMRDKLSGIITGQDQTASESILHL
jgi:uncharacterized protein (TIGR02284 family)